MHLNQTAAGFLQKYSVQVAKSFGVEDASHKFAISDPMETKLRAALLESVEFLRMITTMQVDQIKGQVVIRTRRWRPYLRIGWNRFVLSNNMGAVIYMGQCR